jgi:AcrR family transcriptional regulator
VTNEALATPRQTLSKERVIRAAIDLADGEGLEAVSMRRLGQDLGVEAMALYRHVRDKEALLDGMIDAVVGDIARPTPGPDWRGSMRALALAGRAEMLGHPWAPPVLVSRTEIGPGTLGHVDAVLGILASGGFPLELAHHALHVLGSRVFGFTQDPFNDATDSPPDPVQSAAFARAMAPTFPHVADLALAATHGGALGGCDDDFEFAFGLDLILDGLERGRPA